MTAWDFSSLSNGPMPSIRVSLEIDARARRNAVTKSFYLIVYESAWTPRVSAFRASAWFWSVCQSFHLDFL